MPLKVCLALGPASTKKVGIDDSSDENVEILSDPDSELSDDSGKKKMEALPEGMHVFCIFVGGSVDKAPASIIVLSGLSITSFPPAVWFLSPPLCMFVRKRDNC